MIRIVHKEDCCGCGACAQKCPKQCITMISDGEGFLYPKVDYSFCIDCHQCEQVCLELYPYEETRPIECYAAINSDEQIRLNSSSGGIFSLLSSYIIARGGIVFGARFTEKWCVEISHSDNIEGVRKYRGSKYVQADTKLSFTDAKSFLEQGRLVLFSGTPCHIAGLKHFLGKDYKNLITVDVICHGAPSPKVWTKYLQEIIENARRAISDIRFRNKDNGWRRFNFTLKNKESSTFATISSHFTENHYMRAFLNDMSLRPSCYDCKVKCGRSHSDITLGDFWGIEHVLPAIDDDKGVSLLLINTPKGLMLMRQLSGGNIYHVKFDEVAKYNPSWQKSVTRHPHRNDFFKKLDKSRSVVKLIERELEPQMNIRQRVAWVKSYSVCTIKNFVKLLTEQSGGGAFDLHSSRKHQVSHNELPLYINMRSNEYGWKDYEMKIVLEK